MNYPRHYFVTGTDTGVGKTLVSSLLLHHLRRTNRSAIYMKPVQTGCLGSATDVLAPDVEYVYTANACPVPEPFHRAICPYRLMLPASPHLAAEEEGVSISVDRITTAFESLRDHFEYCILEGAGGILVPLSRDLFMLDLMKALALPVIVVCRPALGTLNHTLMTLNLIRAAGLVVHGLVVVHTVPASDDPTEQAIIADNLQTLEQLGQTAIIACLPYISGLQDPMQARAWLNDAAPVLNGVTDV